MNTENIVLRKMEQNDNNAVKEIIEKVMTEFGAVGEGFSIMDPEVKSMFENYSDKDSAYYVVEESGKIVGGAGIAPLKGGEKGVCELKKMYVLPEARGKGMGKLLMEICMEAAKNIGYKFCYLETLSHMESANILYQKYGFKLLPKSMGNTGHFGCNKWFVKEL